MSRTTIMKVEVSDFHGAIRATLPDDYRDHRIVVTVHHMTYSPENGDPPYANPKIDEKEFGSFRLDKAQAYALGHFLLAAAKE